MKDIELEHAYADMCRNRVKEFKQLLKELGVSTKLEYINCGDRTLAKMTVGECNIDDSFYKNSDERNIVYLTKIKISDTNVILYDSVSLHGISIYDLKDSEVHCKLVIQLRKNIPQINENINEEYLEESSVLNDINHAIEDFFFNKLPKEVNGANDKLIFHAASVLFAEARVHRGKIYHELKRKSDTCPVAILHKYDI